MRCKSVLTRVDALRTGELEKTESNVVESHLRTCKSCDDSLTDVDALAGALKATVQEPPRSFKPLLRESLLDGFDSLAVEGRTLWVAFSARGVRMIRLGGSAAEFERLYLRRFGQQLEPRQLPEKLRAQIAGAASGKGAGEAHVDLDAATEFERTVLEVLTRIPRGEVRSYAWVAEQAGNAKAIRAVGNICARNVLPFVVPCHRVVPTSGGVGQYAFGSAVKRELLRKEGVPVDELEELARAGVRFVGSKTTHIFCCPTCRDARRIQQHNRVEFRDEGQAFQEGYRPCRRCQPVAA